VAVQTIKSIARRRWTEDQQHRFSWYEPLTDPETISRAVHYVLAEPDLFLNTTSDARLLPHLFEAARRFTANPTAPTASDMERDAMDLDITPLFDGNELERI
jgi:ABC-type iron transport system FetAB ATPase subunit